MIRMEIACFFVLALMAVLYFFAKREHTRLHRCFSVLLITAMVHLVLDGMTIYTVNRLDDIPRWCNYVIHKLFLGTMIITIYFVYRYIVLLVEDETRDCQHIERFSTLVLIVGVLSVPLLPLAYVETPKGNYSYGPTVFTIYGCVVIFILLAVITLTRHWKQIHIKKKMAVGLSMGIEIVCLVYQMIRPLALISGMGIMLMVLSFYLTLENPDILLVEQVRQEKRRAEEANAAKSTFLSRMSHEIRTPMNAIVGMTDILLRTKLSAEQREYLGNIKSSGNALVELINDILDLSKIEAGKMELVEKVYDFGQTIKDIRIMIKNRIGDKPVELICEVDESVPQKLYGDGLRIRQVIINLLNNAVKFTEEGHVKLTVKETGRTAETVELFISVSDTGQGIREEDLKKLFGAFQQVDTKRNQGKEGTGLGLSISSQFVEMMGGKLEVKSQYGVGSEFFFTISQKLVTPEMEAEEDAELPVRNFTAPEARILIVDDNEMNRKVALGLLAPFEMQLDTADSGKKALAMIEQKRYHLVFMDQMMPGMDGVEATKLLREKEGDYYRKLPVIALTANAMTEAQKLFEEAGMNGFVAKPIDMRQISGVLFKWLPEALIKENTGEISGNSGNEMPPADAEDTVLEGADIYHLEGIDAKEGIKNSGSRELFVSLLGDFYKLIDVKAGKIEKCLADHMIKDYTIEVHALKNTARMIGAMELSAGFAHLEELGHAGREEEICRDTPEVLEQYRSYKPVLKPFGVRQEGEKREAAVEELVMYLQTIQEAVASCDLDTVDAAMGKLEECRMPEDSLVWMEQLRVAVADVALDEIGESAKALENILGNHL